MRHKQSETFATPALSKLSANEQLQDGMQLDASKYVIQRTSETTREWWTGSGWTDDVTLAMYYDDKPDVSVEAMDESAKAVRLSEIND